LETDASSNSVSGPAGVSDPRSCRPASKKRTSAPLTTVALSATHARSTSTVRETSARGLASSA
jgi:hypothetical protein